MSVIKTLHDVATELQKEDTVSGVCERTTSAAEELLDFNLCTILIREDDWLIPYATSDDAPPDGSRKMRIDEGLAGKTYQAGESEIVSHVTPDDETEPAKETYRSGISVRVGDHGVFQAVETVAEGFDANDLELAELLISHTTTALNRLTREQELQRQNKRLDQFASVVAHDLRNPLNVASGNLELVEADCDSPHLADVADAHERMSQLIDDVLLFARMGTDSIEQTLVPLSGLVEDCWARLATADASLNSTTQQMVQADRDRLQQLLKNLLTNAVDHGGPEVRVTVGDLEDGFYVEDSGPGIPTPNRDEVFTPGFTSTTGGTGFGLNICKQIADAHDWNIEVHEGASGGARFEITGVETLTL